MTADAAIGHILVVDDEKYISDLLKYNLEAERYGVTVVTRAADVPSIDLVPFHLIIADAMGQSFSGMDMLRAIKDNPATSYIPVVILSHSDSQDDIIDALDNGADDYILKPFSLRELMARIRSVLRRRQAMTAPRAATRLQFRGLSVDLVRRQAFSSDGSPLNLTKTEFAILSFLLKNRNTFFNRAQIYDQVWRDQERPANDRIVDTNISRLRKKLGDVAEGLVNRTGQGYALID